MKKNSLKTVKWWQVFLILATIAATVAKIYIGIDHDESYVTVMGIRLLNGDRMFDTMWDLHMTSAWPAWIFTELFYLVTGSLEGLVVFLRYVAAAVQFVAAGVFYVVMKKYYHRDSVFVAAVAVANFLPRATLNLEYGLLEMLGILIACVLLYDVLKKQEADGKTVWWEVVAAGILYALAVLAYPTVVFSFPVLFVALWLLQEKRLGRWKLPAVFAGVCGILAMFFLGYVFSYLTIPEFMQNLQGILSDGTHVDVGKTTTYGLQLIELLKRSVMFAVAAAVLFVVLHRWAPKKEMFLYYLLSVPALALIGLNVTGIRPSGPIGLQVRYLILTIIAFVIWHKMKQHDKKMAGLFLLPGIAVYIGVMYGSNMGIEENASFLYLCLFAGILLTMEYAAAWEDIPRGIGYTCVVLFVVGIIFARGYLVRVTGTFPSNIMENRVTMEDGLLHGIYVYPEQKKELVEQNREIQTYSDNSDTVLYLGNNAICNTFAEGTFTSATTISTPVYNEEWIFYYEDKTHPQPTVIFIDKNIMADWEKFAETEFGEYLVEEYQIEETDVIDGDAFYIIRM